MLRKEPNVQVCDATIADSSVAAGYIKNKDQPRIADPMNNQLMVFLNYMTPIVQVFLLTRAYPL